MSRDAQMIQSQSDQYQKESSESAEAYSSQGGSSQGVAVVIAQGKGKRVI